MTCIGPRKTLFDPIGGENIAFCIDKSGSVFKLWDVICTHLLENLCKLVLKCKNVKFNVIVYDEEVQCFRSKCTKISPQCLVELKRWLSAMLPGGGSYIVPALLASYSDPFVDNVYLITDGLTHKEGAELLYQLTYICNGRPLHAKVISDTDPPSLSAISSVARLVSFTSCHQSTLDVLQIQYQGPFVHISPAAWRPKIPTHLFGRVEDIYEHILEDWKRFARSRCIERQRESPQLQMRSQSVNSLEYLEKGGLSSDDSGIDRMAGKPESYSPNKPTGDAGRNPVRSKLDPRVENSSTANLSESLEADKTAPMRYKPRMSPEPCRCCHHQLCDSCASTLYSRYRAARSFMGSPMSGVEICTDNTSLAPSAGILLLGRQVLAPNPAYGNQIYLGTVISQLDNKTFLINFAEPQSEDYYLSVNIHEMKTKNLFSYSDMQRHAIGMYDHVLVPVSALERTGKSENTRSYFQTPFILARVESGYEARCTGTRSNNDDELLTVRTIKSNNVYPVEPNAAIYVSKSQMAKIKQLYAKKIARNLPLAPQCRLPPCRCGHYIGQKIPSAYSASEIEQLARQMEEQETSRESPMQKSASDLEGGKESYSRETDEARHLFHQLFYDSAPIERDVAQSGSWSEPPKRKHITSEDKKQKPQWRYWGKKPIPNMLDPPYHEPYRDNPDQFRSTMFSSETHFNRVPFYPSQLVDQRDSTRIHLALRDPPKPPISYTDKKTTPTCTVKAQTPEKTEPPNQIKFTVDQIEPKAIQLSKMLEKGEMGKQLVASAIPDQKGNGRYIIESYHCWQMGVVNPGQ